MMADARTQGEAMLRGAGLTNVTSEEHEHVPGDAIHEMGGARMGADPRASVLNGWSQAHDAANLFVTDGAQMASVSCVNPVAHLHGAHRARRRPRREGKACRLNWAGFRPDQQAVTGGNR